MNRPFPARFVNLEAARRTYGRRVDMLGSFLWKTDPLAENVVAAFSELPPGKGKRLLDRVLDEGIQAAPSAPKALVQLFEAIEDVPFWVDRAQLDLGGATFLRSGVFGLFVLGAGSLPMSYLASGGNKALTFSRRLVAMAPRRLFDTMRFQLETCLPGGLERSSEGFKSTIRVRLVHAQMRRVLLASGRWDTASWGAPINQADKAATNVLFSAYPLQWLRRLGFHFTPEESDAVIQLWRYSGHLLGIDPALLCATETEGLRLHAMMMATQGPPDDDARMLTKTVMEAAPALVEKHIGESPWIADVWAAFARFFLGDALVDALGIPKTNYRLALPAVRAAIARSEAIRRRSTRATELASRMGTDFERFIVGGGDGAGPPGTIDAVLGSAQRWVERSR
jgi:hypothetical protein